MQLYDQDVVGSDAVDTTSNHFYKWKGADLGFLVHHEASAFIDIRPFGKLGINAVVNNAALHSFTSMGGAFFFVRSTQVE